LHNPYSVVKGGDTVEVAKASRKTDVYSFAVLAWEVLSQKHPFTDVGNEVVLSAKVHQGQRPPLDACPRDTPPRVLKLIEACWSRSRGARKVAVECYAVLDQCYSAMHADTYDVLLSFDCEQKSQVPNHIFHRLTQLGFRVWRSEVSIEDESENQRARLMNAIKRSKCFMAVVTLSYQDQDECLSELRAIKAAKKFVTIIPVFIEPNHAQWASQDLVYILQLRSPTLMSFDMSSVSSDPMWDQEDGPSLEVLSRLSTKVDEFALHIRRVLDDSLC
jgi:hypothetical protein